MWALKVKEPLRRKGGQLKGLIEIPDNFDDPLPSEYLDAFYGKDELWWLSEWDCSCLMLEIRTQ